MTTKPELALLPIPAPGESIASGESVASVDMATTRSMEKSFAAELLEIGRIFMFFARRRPLPTVLSIIAMVLAGGLESIGLLSLAPLIELVVGNSRAEMSGISQEFARYFDAIGLPLALEPILIGIVLTLILKNLILFAALAYIGYIQASLTRELRAEFITDILNAQWSFFVAEKQGRFINTATNEIANGVAIYRTIADYLASLVKVTVLFITALAVFWFVTVGAIIGGLVLWIALRGLVRMGRKAGALMAQRMKSLSANVADGLGAIKVFKSMDAQAHILDMLHRDVEDLRIAHWRSIAASQGLSHAREPIAGILVAAMLFAFANSIALTSSALLMMLALFYRMFGEMSRMQAIYMGIRAKEVFFYQFHELMTAAKAAAEPPHGSVVPTLVNAIELRGVTFAYGQQVVLADADLEIPAGQLVALVGPSGSGKSTTADILCALQRPQRGRVLVDGVPMQELDIALWRRSIGYVPQDSVLFHESVLANVTLYDGTFDRDEVVGALKRAGAWDFVAALPRGLDTIVGERGLRFSGGQKQRIAIARALIRRPRLLILDEATTGLDPDSEQAICGTLRALASQVTVLAITHQEAIVDIADRIYRLENGRFVRTR